MPADPHHAVTLTLTLTLTLTQARGLLHDVGQRAAALERQLETTGSELEVRSSQVSQVTKSR